MLVGRVLLPFAARSLEKRGELLNFRGVFFQDTCLKVHVSKVSKKGPNSLGDFLADEISYPIFCAEYFINHYIRGVVFFFVFFWIVPCIGYIRGL